MDGSKEWATVDDYRWCISSFILTNFICRNIIVDNSRVGGVRVGPEKLIPLKKGLFKAPKKAAGKHTINHSDLSLGVYEFTATINAETYERLSSTSQRLRPAAWAIVKKGEEKKVTQI